MGQRCINLVLNKTSQREIIKEISEVRPDSRARVLPQALVIESINLTGERTEGTSIQASEDLENGNLSIEYKKTEPSCSPV